jgi:colanic acid/amylovoran biosynthesis glycosyltransferase
MKIAVIVGGFPLLSETWILSQVTGLLDRGHEVDIYARRRPSTPAAHEAVAEYDLLAHTHYFDLPMSRLGRIARATTSIAGSLPRYPGPMLRCFNLPRYRSLYAVLNNVMFVPPFLRRRYDAILCHFGGNGIDFIVLKDALPKTRFVTMFHGEDYFIGDEKGPRVFDLLRRMGDAFLVTTDCFGRETLRRCGFDDDKIVTLRLAIDVKRIPFRERQANGRTFRVLTVGRLVAKKGLDTGIRAVAALRAANPQVQVEYRVIGDGPLRADLANLVRDLDAETTVHLLGPRVSGEVMQCMQEADVYLLPSRMEQAGYVLLEAQASGLPVVATRIGGVPEMVREGRSALLVEPDNVPAMTAALQHLLDSPSTWSSMGREGRQHVEELFDTHRLTTRLEDVLRG